MVNLIENENITNSEQNQRFHNSIDFIKFKNQPNANSIENCHSIKSENNYTNKIREQIANPVSNNVIKNSKDYEIDNLVLRILKEQKEKEGQEKKKTYKIE